MKNVQWGGGILDRNKKRNPKDLKRFDKNKKLKIIFISSIIGILLIIGGISLYRTFALYKEEKTFNVLEGTVPDFSFCELEENTKWEFDYQGKIEKEFKIPCWGKYKLEVWGASGGNTGTFVGGKGAYVTGNIKLRKGNILYINVGEGGLSNVSPATSPDQGDTIYKGSYNGGGGSVAWNSLAHDIRVYVGIGGGATSIATKSGELYTLSNNKEDILLVAGGGGASTYYYTYDFDENYFYGNGGAAGGLTGYDGNGGGRSLNHCNPGKGGSSTSLFGKGEDGIGTAQMGGGGGYYGGLKGWRCGGGGGTSYIKSNFTDTKMIDGMGYSWTTTKGTKTDMPKHDGTDGTMVGNTGNGYARITYLGKN